MSGTQIGVNRTSDKTIQFFGQQQVFRQAEGSPLGLDVIVTIEGRDNFQEIYSPAVGAVVSTKDSGRMARSTSNRSGSATPTRSIWWPRR